MFDDTPTGTPTLAFPLTTPVCERIGQSWESHRQQRYVRYVGECMRGVREMKGPVQWGKHVGRKGKFFDCKNTMIRVGIFSLSLSTSPSGQREELHLLRATPR